jgi:hypothetical protein
MNVAEAVPHFPKILSHPAYLSTRRVPVGLPPISNLPLNIFVNYSYLNFGVCAEVGAGTSHCVHLLYLFLSFLISTCE